MQRFLQCLCFADDAWTVAGTWQDFVIMSTEFVLTLRAEGFDIELPKCRWHTSLPDHTPHTLEIAGEYIPRVSRHEGIKMLGLPATTSTSTWPGTAARIAATVGYVHSRRRLWSLKGLPRRLRVRFAYEVAPPVLSWGAESFTMTVAQRDKVDAAQRRLLRSAARLPRIEGEGPRSYIHRANEFIADVFSEDPGGFHTWSAYLERRKFVFAGHAVRYDEIDLEPSIRYHSVLSEVLAWRSLHWQRSARARGAEPLHRVGHPRRWEQMLFDWALLRFNTQWTEIARSSSTSQWETLWPDYWAFVTAPTATRRVPDCPLVNCRCGGVHFPDKPCWPGFRGQEWVYFVRADGTHGRVLLVGPLIAYDVGAYVFRCDGACPGQGGPQRRRGGRIGAGAWLFHCRHDSYRPVCFATSAAGDGTNNVAELMAMQMCLQLALERRLEYVIIECDSKVVVNWILGDYRLQSSDTGLIQLYRTTRNPYFRLLTRARVQLRWIPRNRNGTADALARHAVEFTLPWTEFGGSDPVVSRSAPWLLRAMIADGFIADLDPLQV